MSRKLILLICMSTVIYLSYRIFFTPNYKSTFPFSKADNIELIYYDKPLEGYSYLTKFKDVPVKKRLQLSDIDKEKIFKILYRENTIIKSSGACFNPNHALLFKNKKDTIGIIEICIECSQIRATDGITLPTIGESIINNLDDFFKSKE